MPARRLLVVAYYYPPDQSVGGNRWAAMTRYLRAMGHDVTVLTTRVAGGAPDDGDHVVRTGDLQASTRLRRLLRRPALGPADGTAGKGGSSVAAQAAPPAWLDLGMVPDAYAISWLPGAVHAARRIARERAVECVITTAPPDSVALVPMFLGQSRPAWIADFRDGWRYEPLRGAWPTRLQDRIDARLERRVVRTAEVVIGATRPIASDFQQRLGAQAIHVPNAWDPELDADVDAAGPVRLERGTVNLVHTGQLSGPRGRDPRPLFAAMRRLADQRGHDAQRLRLVLVGGLDAGEERALADLDVRQMVQVSGQQSRPTAVATQRAADALLLLTSPGHVSQATGKLCEYLVAKRPILALARGNEAERMVLETGTGVAVAPDDVEGIARELGRILDGELRLDHSNQAALARYRYPGPARAVAELVETAIARR